MKFNFYYINAAGETGSIKELSLEDAMTLAAATLRADGEVTGIINSEED